MNRLWLGVNSKTFNRKSKMPLQYDCENAELH